MTVDYQQDEAMRALKERIRRLELTVARNKPAGGISYTDTGGNFGGGFPNLQDILDAIGAGTAPDVFLTKTLGGQGTVQALGTLGATETIDLANGNKFWGTLDQACTITTTGWTNLKDCQISVELIQDGTGGWTPTFSGVTWIGGTPTWITTAGTVTHVVLFSRDGGTTIYGAVVGGSGSASSLGWFDVTDYGATGDGVTDDTAAINAAIAALNANGRGVLYFPAGKYVTTGGLTTITVPCTILGDGRAGYDGSTNYGSQITCSSTTANLFTLDQEAVAVRNLSLLNTAGSAPTAGAAIDVLVGTPRGSLSIYENLTIKGFWIDMRLVGAAWTARDVYIYSPVQYGIHVVTGAGPDSGDQVIDGCYFQAETYNAAAAIRIDAGGGPKIYGCKINSYDASHKFVAGIEVAIATGVSTSVFVATGNSIENISGDAILITTTGTGTFGLCSITASEFGLYGNNTGRAVKISAATNGTLFANGSIGTVVIDGLTMNTDGTARAAIELVNTDNVVLGDLVYYGFNARYTSSGDTNTSDGGIGAPAGADYLVGTAHAGLSAEIVVGTTPGGDLGGTWAAPVVEAIDGVAVSGTPSADDVLTATGATTAAWAAPSVAAASAIAAMGFVGPILISDTPSTPLVFADLIQNEAQDDLVYADV